MRVGAAGEWGASYNARMLSDEYVPSFPPSASPLLAGLNTEQAAAVTLPAEHALILAGAGSGKTRVLTTRIAWLLQSGQVTPGGVLAVTFTNKAAKEMMTRLSAMLPVNVRGMWIGTFHGLCNRFLRAHHQLAGLPQTFQILDTQDQLSAVKRLCKQFNVDDERFPPKQLQYFISGCKEDGQRPGDVVARDEDTRKKVELYALYEEQCQREGVVDFGELMLRSYEVLRDNAPVREHYQRRFRHILVDEFQDTNRLQYAWLKLFSSPPATGLPGPGNAVFAVGDDDQSIYAFRGARVGNMADFVREFHVRHQIKLEQNYRSCSNILDSANQLISHNSHRLGKNLRTDAGAGEPVRVFEATSDFAEAQWMVDEMKQLVREGMPRTEIAVLYRSNAQSRVVESALFNAAMPYRVYGGLRFFERAEIKHALAYLRLLENPHDDTSFLRVVNFPPRGIGARSLEQLQDVARASGCSLHDGVSAVTGRAGVAIGAFVAKLDVLRERSEGMTLSEIIELVLEHSGLVDHYRAEREGQERVENLEELVSAAKSFVGIEGFGRDAVARTGSAAAGLTQSPASQGLDLSIETTSVRSEPVLRQAQDGRDSRSSTGSGRTEMVEPDTGETMSPLAAFLTHAALESGDNQAQAGQDAVQLMTVHAAKGLEFDCVFITGMEEGLFPHENAMSDRDGLEEERRLMYVAITRARQRLYLSHSQTRMLHGQTRYNLKSRFFDELPEACLKWLTPPQQAPGWAGAGGGGTWQNGRRPYGSAPVLQPAWSPGFAERGDPKGLGQTAPEPDRGTDIRAGQKVFHNKFGEGKVQAVEGAGADARAQVNFSRHGVKWLALGVAKLTPVDD
jgi:DNA helicase II / ATP-dependent DNA helicase PcrA